MPVVTKTIRDGNGETFSMRFWQAGDGTLSPLHAVSSAAGESLLVQLSGRSTVDVGGTDFSTDGSVIYGLAANRPDADDAHAAIPFAYYKSVDTGALDQTDGTNWVSQ